MMINNLYHVCGIGYTFSGKLMEVYILEHRNNKQSAVVKVYRDEPSYDKLLKDLKIFVNKPVKQYIKPLLEDGEVTIDSDIFSLTQWIVTE